MTRNGLRLALLVACTLTAACASRQPMPDPAEGLAGTEWVLAAISGEPVEAGAEVTLRWESGGRVGGSTGVNRWFGTCALDRVPRLAFSEIGMTRRAGPLELMQQETRFVEALQVVEELRRIDGGLQLYGRGRLLLSFLED